MAMFTRLYRGETNIDFIGHRKRWYAASGVILLICLLSFIFRGFNYGIEFSGGTTFQLSGSSSSLTTSAVNKAFTQAHALPANLPQVTGSGSGRQIVVETANLNPTVQHNVAVSVGNALHISPNSISVTSIGNSWGHDTTIKALEGLIVFLIVVSIYIAIRFGWRMAAGALIALLHDLIVAAGVYSLVGFSVTPSTVVGLLTILGFSLYDTVVVYDKVNENADGILRDTKFTYGEAANLAVNQTLMRSINTSLIALLPVAGLLFVGAGLLGVGTIKDLALVLFVGLASGAYSSLFLATPAAVEFTEREARYVTQRRKVLAARAKNKNGDESLGGPQKASGGPAPAPLVGAKPKKR